METYLYIMKYDRCSRGDEYTDYDFLDARNISDARKQILEIVKRIVNGAFSRTSLGNVLIYRIGAEAEISNNEILEMILEKENREQKEKAEREASEKKAKKEAVERGEYNLYLELKKKFEKGQ